MILNEALAFVGGIGGILGGLFWAVKFLIGFYFKKETELAKVKDQYAKQQLAIFDEKIKKLEQLTDRHTIKITETTVSLEKNYSRYNAQSESVKAAVDTLKDTSLEIKRDFRDFRNEVKTDVKELNNNLLLFKTRKS